MLTSNKDSCSSNHNAKINKSDPRLTMGYNQNPTQATTSGCPHIKQMQEPTHPQGGKGNDERQKSAKDILG